MKCLFLMHYRLELVYETAQRWQWRLFNEPTPGHNHRSFNEKVLRNTALGALIKTLSSDESIYVNLHLDLLLVKINVLSIINIFLYRKTKEYSSLHHLVTIHLASKCGRIKKKISTLL